MKEEMATLGNADSAFVTSIGSVQQGRFIYEWGQAEAHFPDGGKSWTGIFLHGTSSLRAPGKSFAIW